MNLQQRIDLLSRLGDYILSNEKPWHQVKENAGLENNWFIPEFVELATTNIGHSFLQKNILEKWVTGYPQIATGKKPKTVGIVMAGNIPLVGFHDWLAVFLSGNRPIIKPSSKDQVLIKHLIAKIDEWSAGDGPAAKFSEMLKGCDAYIATGSYNTSRYFEYYFAKYPHIIRKNKTAVAILDGNETRTELEKLSDDIYTYFGRGCRNVTKLYVPDNYDFVPLLEAARKYNYLADHHKYKNNYDYNLALHLLNNKYYMTNGSVLLIESPALFTPISQVNYEFYSNREMVTAALEKESDLQCIAGKGYLAFGQAQSPGIADYADGVDTMDFLANL